MVNILLLFLALGRTRWKRQPYAGTLVLVLMFGEFLFARATGRSA